MPTNYIKVASTSDIPVGTAKVVEVNGERIAICNVDKEFFAISDICTHDSAPLDQGELDGEVIECPRHGAQFNVKTGHVVRRPAITPINTYLVQVRGADIEVSLDQ